MRGYLNDVLLDAFVPVAPVFQSFAMRPAALWPGEPQPSAQLAPRPVALPFTEPLANTMAVQRAIRVFSQQRGGRRSGTSTASGSMLTLVPAPGFKPSETLFMTTAAASGAILPRGQGYQFTTATGGTGRGNFTPPCHPPRGERGQQTLPCGDGRRGPGPTHR